MLSQGLKNYHQINKRPWRDWQRAPPSPAKDYNSDLQEGVGGMHNRKQVAGGDVTINPK